MTRWTAGAALLAAVGTAAGAGAQAPAFEGSISLRMFARGAQGTSTQQMEYLVRGGKVRVNVSSPGGGMTMIAVPQDRKLYMLAPAQNAYVEIPLPDAAAVARGNGVQPEEAKITRTGRVETIAGLACEHVQVSTRTGATDMCLTRALGRFVNPLDGMRQGGAPDWQKQLADEFPLKVILPDGSIPLEVTRVERKRLSNDLFAVPGSYTKMTMPPRRPPG